MGGMVFPKVVDKNLKIQELKIFFVVLQLFFQHLGVYPTLIICALAERLSVFLKQK